MTVQMTVQSTDIDVELGGLKYGHAMPEKKHAKTEKGVAGTMLFSAFRLVCAYD